MSIQFSEIPEGALTPFFAVEIDPTGASGSGGTMPWRVLIIGSDGLPAGEHLAEMPLLSVEELIKKGVKADSQIMQMLKAWKDNAPFTISISVKIARSDAEAARAIATLEDEWFNAIVLGGSEGALTTDAMTELKKRWAAEKSLPAVVFFGKETQSGSEAIAVAGPLNFQCLVCLPFPDKRDAGVWASALAATAARSAANDPAMPLQTLEVLGVEPPAKGYRREEREAMLRGGVASWTKVGNSVRLERIVTTYLKNGAGAEDTSYQDVTTVFSLVYLRWAILNLFYTKYSRHKLADDGARFGDGQPVMTPKLARAEIVGLYREWERAGLVEGADAFKEALIVERNTRNRNRLDIYLRPDLVNQLTVLGVKMGFLL